MTQPSSNLNQIHAPQHLIENKSRVMWAVLLAACGPVVASAWCIQIADGNDGLQIWKVGAYTEGTVVNSQKGVVL
jgi:hypothetical protein